MRRLSATFVFGVLILALLSSCDSPVTSERQPERREVLAGVGDTIVAESDAVTLISVEATVAPVGMVGEIPEHWVGVVYDLENRREYPVYIPFMSAGAAVEGAGTGDSYGSSVGITWSPEAVIPGERMYQETQLKPGASIRIAVQIPCEAILSPSEHRRVICSPFGTPDFVFEAVASAPDR